MLKKLMAAILICLLLAAPGFCANQTPWGQGDIHPQLGRQLPYDLVYLGQDRGGVSTMVSGSTAIPLGYSVVKKEVGSAVALTLANGIPGQILHFTISSYSESDPGSPTLTPTTKTGFASLEFNAAGDSVTLLYVDNTSGWVLIGSNSVTVNQ
jgi:hypothetical protein